MAITFELMNENQTITVRQDADGNAVLLVNGQLLPQHKSPRYYSNQKVKFDKDADAQPYDVVYTDTTAYFRWIGKDDKGVPQTCWTKIINGGEGLGEVNEDDIAFFEATEQTMQRLAKKHVFVISVEIVNKLISTLPTNDSGLDWYDIRQLNTHTLALRSNNTDIQKQALENINLQLQTIAEYYQLTDEERHHFLFDISSEDALTQSRNQILNGIDEQINIHKINNNYIRHMFAQERLENLSADAISNINQFFNIEPNEIDAHITPEALTKLFVDNNIKIVDPKNFDKDVNYIKVNARALTTIEQLRNPFLADLIKDICPYLNTSAPKLFNDAWVAFNHVSQYPHGQMDEHTFFQHFKNFVTENPKVARLPFTAAELEYIHLYNTYLHTIDTQIAPQFPYLAQSLEAYLHDVTHHYIQIDKHEQTLFNLLEIIQINHPEDITDTLNDVENDMRQGATLFEAMNSDRLRRILVLQYPTKPNNLTVEQYLDAVAPITKNYDKLIDDLRENIRLNDDALGKAINEKAYVNLMDEYGNKVQLRINKPLDADTPPTLIALQYCPLGELPLTLPNESKQIHHNYLLEILQPDDEALDDKLSTQENGHDNHDYSYNDRVVYGIEKLANPLWSLEDKCWYQYHWCTRSQSLGRIDENGKKSVFKFNSDNEQWERAPDDDVKRISWPKHTVAFPTRPPLAKRGFNNQLGEEIDDAETLEKSLKQYERKYHDHVEYYQPNEMNSFIYELSSALPEDNATHIQEDINTQLKAAVKTLADVENKISQARKQLTEIQDSLAATLANVFAKRTVIDAIHQNREGIQHLYHNDFELQIRQYSLMLAACKNLKTKIHKLLANTKIGVQVKEPGLSNDENVNVTFGSAQDNSLYVDNDIVTSVEPVEQKIQTSENCTITVKRNLHQTIAAFPETAQTEDLVKGFERTADFSQGKLPIHIRFNPKKKGSQAAAETLRDQALAYLKEKKLDANVYLLINDKPFPESSLKLDNDKRTDAITKARDAQKEHSPTTRQKMILKHSIHGMKKVLKDIKKDDAEAARLQAEADAQRSAAPAA